MQQNLIRTNSKGMNIEKTDIHHITPITQKGARHKVQNMVLIHRACHKKVHKVESHYNKDNTR